MNPRDVVNTAIVSLVVIGIGLVIWSLVRRRHSSVPQAIDRSAFDPSIVNNIRHQIVPYIISAELLPDLPEYSMYRLYAYVRSFLAAIVGIGFASPVLKYLNKIPAVGDQATTASQAPPDLGYVGLGAVLVLVFCSVYISKSNLDKRAVLADSCEAQFRGFYAKLLTVTTGSDVASELDSLSNEIATVVQRHIAEKAWTFEHVIAPDIESRIEAMTDVILARIPQPVVRRTIQQPTTREVAAARLLAEFEMKGGMPSFEQREQYKHYRIRLSVVDAPPDVLTIIYQLDSSYKNSIRMVTKGVPDFQEYITAYGNNEIRVSFRSTTEPSKLQALLSERLSDAISARYDPSPPAAIQAAIDEINSH